MTRRALLLLLALAVASLVLVSRREGGPRATAAEAGRSPASRGGAPRAEPDVDPGSIRDVFRFVEPRFEATPRPAASEPPAALAAPSPEPFRLVGLVRRQGKLLAAFALGGDVVLAGPGDSVAGATVLEVGEEGVRIRRGDGSESRLALP